MLPFYDVYIYEWGAFLHKLSIFSIYMRQYWGENCSHVGILTTSCWHRCWREHSITHKYILGFFFCLLFLFKVYSVISHLTLAAFHPWIPFELLINQFQLLSSLTIYSVNCFVSNSHMGNFFRRGYSNSWAFFFFFKLWCLYAFGFYFRKVLL